MPPYSNNRSPYTGGNQPPRNTPRGPTNNPPGGLNAKPPAPAQAAPPPATIPPRPYQPTSPYRPNPVQVYKPTSPVRITPPAAGAGAAAGGGGIGILLPALLLAIPQVLLFDSPAAAPELMPPEPAQPVEPPEIPFNGGQSSGVLYDVTYQLKSPSGIVTDTGRYYGPIARAYFQRLGSNTIYYLISGGHYFYGYHPDLRTDSITNYFSLDQPSIKITNIKRVDGQPDTGGNPSPTNTPIYSNPGNPVSTPQPQAPSNAPPPAQRQPQGQPLPQLQQRTPTPAPAPVPTATPQPLPQPQPIGQPQPVPIGQPQPLPLFDPAPQPGLNLAPPPTAAPTPAPTPTPTLSTPTAPFPPTILITPGGNPGPLIFTPNPSTGNPTPTPTPVTSPTPERSPDPEPTDIEKIRDTVNRLLVPIGIGVTGITALLNPVGGKLDQIKNQTDPNTLKEISKSATCETFQPGGCAAGLPENARDAANNSANNATTLSAITAALSGITAFLQALATTFLQPILAGVDLINNKLGPVMAGVDGIGGFLSRLSKSLGVDRALNLIAIASNLHNAMMLSASLKITLLEVLSSVGNATGLLQTSEGDNVDLNAVFNQGIEKFMTLLLGEENYAGLKVGLRKYSAIYRAANNVLNNVGNMFSSIGNGIEVIGERTGKIGNAIRAAGMVRENAYQWMSEKMTVHTNKFMTFQTTVGGVTEALESINEIAESTIEGQQSYTEAVKATAEFKKVLEEGTKEGAKDSENKAIAEEAAKIKENISKDPTGEKDQGYLSFLTD